MIKDEIILPQLRFETSRELMDEEEDSDDSDFNFPMHGRTRKSARESLYTPAEITSNLGRLKS